MVERNLSHTNPVCFFCTRWQPNSDESESARIEILSRAKIFAPAHMEGICSAVNDLNSYLKTTGGCLC